MSHKNKNKEDRNLVYIEKTDKEQSFLKVALKVLSMYEEDYNLTISEITSILKCERQWVTKYVQDNVKHIFLNEQYRRLLIGVNKTHFIIKEKLVLKDYYYFSRSDFYRWLKENTVATKQTQRVDVNLYSNNISEFKLLKYKHIKDLNNSKNIISIATKILTYEDKIRDTLSPLGQEIAIRKLGVLNRKDTSEVKLKNFNIPKNLTSIKELKNWYGKSLEIVYRDLYKYGAIKYTIAGSLVRYDEDFRVENYKVSDYPYIITIPYEYYLKIKKVETI